MGEIGRGAPGRLGKWLAVLAVAALLAACGGPGTPPALSPASSGSSVPAPNYRYVNPALFPDKDTPLAQASAQLQQVWTPYDVTVIPSRHVLDGMPTPPKVINDTHGALSDTDAEALAWAEYRQSALLGWMEATVQPGLNGHLRVSGLFNGSIGNAVRAGQSVSNPPCDLYATAIAVVPVDPSITAFEAGRGYAVSSQYALVETYASPGCAVKTSAGQTLFTFTNAVNVETGTVRHDDVLGDMFYAESGRNCDMTSSDPRACKASG